MKPRRISVMLLTSVLMMSVAGTVSPIYPRVAFGARPALSGSLASHSTASHSTASLRTSTVFGRGPELHLLPNFGPVGTRVSVVGLGYPRGAHIRIIYGSPNAEFMPQPIASATVAVNGTFRTAFTVPCAFVVLHSRRALHPPKTCPLSSTSPFRAVVVGTQIGQRFPHKPTESQGFIVTG